jgi:hypothetical protein
MERVVPVLLVVLIVAVVGLGIVEWRADQHAREAADRELCVERAHATATIALLTPAERVDADGRLAAVRSLGAAVDAC